MKVEIMPHSSHWIIHLMLDPMISMKSKANSCSLKDSGLRVSTLGAVQSMKIDKINSSIFWEWKGNKEYQETKQSIIDDRKRLQKFANRVASRKQDSLKELEACKLFLNTLIDNEKYFKQIKEIRDKAKLVS
jgi:hypothetical protein